MSQCIYEPVGEDGQIIPSNQDIVKTSWKPFLIQLLVSSSIWTRYFTAGLCLGAPTVIIPQLRREANSTDTVSPEMASWMSSIHGYAAILWFIVPIISGRIGRKYPFIATSGISLIRFVILYCSSTPKYMLMAEIFQGAIFACCLTTSIMIVIEYTTPQHRGLFLTIKSASANWGIWIANALGTFFHWRTIAVLGMIASIYSIFSALFWYESPSWLASKNRYEECAKNHRCIKGEDAESEKELAALIESCKKHQKQEVRDKLKQPNILIRFYRTLLEKAFYMPLLLSVGMITLLHSTGKLVVNVYAIDIIKKITSKESTAYTGMLFLDAVTVVCMYIGCALARFAKRRILYITGSLGGIIFLFILSLYLYLCKSNVIVENTYVSLFLLMMFFVFISIGPLILSTSIYGELMPLRFRTAGMFLIGIWTELDLATTLITGPPVFKAFNLHGAFLFYGTKCLIILIFLYKFLPETKDKTLQEIEEYFVGEQKKHGSLEDKPMCN